MSVPDRRHPAAGADVAVDLPGGMTSAEKLAAEWEARHDVLARGHRADPLALQHYLAHARAHEALSRSAPPAPAIRASAPSVPQSSGTPPSSTARSSAPPAPTPGTDGHRAAAWWRRLLGRSTAR